MLGGFYNNIDMEGLGDGLGEKGGEKNIEY